MISSHSEEYPSHRRVIHAVVGGTEDAVRGIGMRHGRHEENESRYRNDGEGKTNGTPHAGGDPRCWIYAYSGERPSDYGEVGRFGLTTT